MSKIIRTLLVIAASCVLGGIVIVTACVGIARAQNISLVGQMEGRRYADRTYENTGAQSREFSDVRSLDLRLIGEPVTIRQGDVERVTVEWSQNWDHQYDLTETLSGQISLRRNDLGADSSFGVFWNRNGLQVNYDSWLSLLDGGFWWNRNWSWNGYNDIGSSRPVTVTVPEGAELDKISIIVVSGTVDIEGVLADWIDYSGVDTRLDLRDCEVRRLTLANVSGRVTARDSVLDSAEMGTVSGRLELNGGSCVSASVEGVNARLSVSGTTDVHNARVGGLNAEASLTLPGSRQDYMIVVEGLNSELSVDGQYYGRQSLSGGSGSLRAEGLNAVLRVWFEDR